MRQGWNKFFIELSLVAVPLFICIPEFIAQTNVLKIFFTWEMIKKQNNNKKNTAKCEGLAYIIPRKALAM